MAAKDPKARRGAINYENGRVVGCIGLLDYLFGVQLTGQPVVLKRDSRNRLRAVGLMNRTAAVGGKQLIVYTKDGQQYQLHYGGTWGHFLLNGIPKMNRAVVLAVSTARGKLRYI